MRSLKITLGVGLIAVTFFTGKRLGAKENYCVKIREQPIVKIETTIPQNLVSLANESALPGYGTIRQVQATELPDSPGAPDAWTTDNGFAAPGTLQETLVQENGPVFVGPATDNRNSGSLQPLIKTPTASPSASYLVTGDTVIPEGCPDCNCVVCECAATCIPCDPCPPLGNICGASCCCPPWWIRKEVLAWFAEGDQATPLVTTSDTGTAAGTAGVLGQPNTSVLFDSFDNDPRFGLRLAGGFWFDPCRCRGFEFEGWWLGKLDDNYNITSDGDPIVARPFFNTDIAAPDAQIVAHPELSSGSIDVDYDGQMFSVAPLWRFNARCGAVCRRGRQVTNRFDLLAGYRYWHFEEELTITERLEPIGAFFAPGTAYTLTDAVRTRNDFHGGEVGIEWLRQRKKLVLEMSSRIAIGQMFRRINATGSTQFLVPGVLDVTQDGGFHVPPGGIRVRDNKFTVVPQARIALGYYFRPCLRVYLGYDFAFFPNIVRPGGVLNSSIPGSALAQNGRAQPRVFEGFDDTDIWVQGLSFGTTLNF